MSASNLDLSVLPKAQLAIWPKLNRIDPCFRSTICRLIYKLPLKLPKSGYLWWKIYMFVFAYLHGPTRPCALLKKKKSLYVGLVCMLR